MSRGVAAKETIQVGGCHYRPQIVPVDYGGTLVYRVSIHLEDGSYLECSNLQVSLDTSTEEQLGETLVRLEQLCQEKEYREGQRPQSRYYDRLASLTWLEQVPPVAPQACTLCPRSCGADRTSGVGLCKGGARPKAARAMLHHWEEPCISGTSGSGAVFFSGCTLQCCYCQNQPISGGNFGKEISTRRLAEIFLELQAQGAHNINLVTGSHYLPWILAALRAVRPQLTIPVIYNCGGYETLDSLQRLEGLVDIYLPDLKYHSAELAQRYSGASDYFTVASAAILEMFRQVGEVQYGEDGLLKRGLLIRHLVLPGSCGDSIQLLDWVATTFDTEKILLSVMSQFCPTQGCQEDPLLSRKVSTFEYNKVLHHMAKLGLDHGYTQERTSAQEQYTPDFSLQGL